MNQYFNDIREGIRTTLTGLKLTLRHFWQARDRRRPINVQDDRYFEQQTGMITLQYPFETLPIPDNGRYRLHNEIDDCIVCDKCAKVCPVDCITIDTVKATEEVGRASDGSPIRLYAATFDIDMAKCCYCGLCTTVCPTECLTMTKTYDFSEYELGNMTYHFTNLTPEQAEEKRRLYEQFVREKEELKAQQAAAKAAEAAKAAPRVDSPADATAVARKPVFRPGMKPAAKPENPATEEVKAENPVPIPETPPADTPAAKPRPVFRPSAPKPTEPTANQESAASVEPSAEKPRPAFRPTMKPAAPKPEAPPEEEPKSDGPAADVDAAKPRPAFRPTMKPKTPPPAES